MAKMKASGGAQRRMSLMLTRQTGIWLAGLVVLVSAVGWLSNMVLGSAVERAVYRGAISTSERWATFFAENMPRLPEALAGQVDTEQVAYVHSVEKMGDVFRFKLFDGEGRLVFVSDEVEKLLAGEALPVEEEPFAQNVLKSGVPFAEVADGTGKKNRPPLYAEAYVPVRNTAGKVLGVAEVYVDQTEAEAQICSAFYGLGLTLAALAGLAVAVPGFAFLWRNQQALRASRKAAELEAANLEMERAQSAELGAHNEQLIGLNKELAVRMKELGEAHDELVEEGPHGTAGQLTATVAHERRNPLGVVRTLTLLLEPKLRAKVLVLTPRSNVSTTASFAAMPSSRNFWIFLAAASAIASPVILINGWPKCLMKKRASCLRLSQSPAKWVLMAAMFRLIRRACNGPSSISSAMPARRWWQGDYRRSLLGLIP